MNSAKITTKDYSVNNSLIQMRYTKNLKNMALFPLFAKQ